MSHRLKVLMTTFMVTAFVPRESIAMYGDEEPFRGFSYYRSGSPFSQSRSYAQWPKRFSRHFKSGNPWLTAGALGVTGLLAYLGYNRQEAEDSPAHPESFKKSHAMQSFKSQASLPRTSSETRRPILSFTKGILFSGVHASETISKYELA